MATTRLPNLLVAGVPKAGTGSLFAYLDQHPEICGADEKELGYFNFYNPRRHSGPVPPLEVYLRHFAHVRDERYAFEATPTYSYGGQPVIDAIREVLGSPKIVLSLRDPVERLWSAYTFQRGLGNLPDFAHFEDYLEACERRKRDGSDLVPGDHLHGLYIGFYGNYVPLWLEAFGHDLKVVFTEELQRDPRGVVGDIFRWLEVDDTVAAQLDLVPRNATHHPRSTTAARMVFSLKRAGDRVGLVPSSVRRPLRRLYERANAGSPPQQMSPDVRRHVEELYRSSTHRTALALSAHGYRDLPPWLQVTATT